MTKMDKVRNEYLSRSVCVREEENDIKLIEGICYGWTCGAHETKRVWESDVVLAGL